MYKYKQRVYVCLCQRQCRFTIWSDLWKQKLEPWKIEKKLSITKNQEKMMVRGLFISSITLNSFRCRNFHFIMHDNDKIWLKLYFHYVHHHHVFCINIVALRSPTKSTQHELALVTVLVERFDGFMHVAWLYINICVEKWKRSYRDRRPIHKHTHIETHSYTYTHKQQESQLTKHVCATPAAAVIDIPNNMYHISMACLAEYVLCAVCMCMYLDVCLVFAHMRCESKAFCCCRCCCYSWWWWR